jgi:hypothetical protein
MPENYQFVVNLSIVKVPFPERACVVKGSLCGLCRLEVHIFLSCLQTFRAVCQDRLFGLNYI